jgi:hypothetical protein
LSYYGLTIKRATLSSTLLPLFLAAACGGKFVVDGSLAATTGAGGATLGTGGATTSSSAGTGGASCAAGAFIELLLDDHEQVQMTASCNGVLPLPVPFGQEEYDSDGAGSTPGLYLVGCVTSASNSASFALFASGAFAPGTFPVRDADYKTGGGGTNLRGSGNVGTLQVDQLGPVGGTISGSFQLTLPSNALLQGKFVVCRAPDSGFVGAG